MAYEYVFDAQPTVNGTNIKDILINGKYPDEVYCNGSHIAHLKKDVTVSLWGLYLHWTGKFKTEAYSVGTCNIEKEYTKYWAICEVCSVIAVSQDLITTGKRIKKIDWKGFLDDTISRPWGNGTIEYPENSEYLNLLYSDFQEVPIHPLGAGEEDFCTEDGINPLNTHSCFYCKTCNYATITYTNGTTETIGEKNDVRHLKGDIVPSFWDNPQTAVFKEDYFSHTYRC